MKCNSYEEARKQAQDNANWTGGVWVAFFDTSGNARCERKQDGAIYEREEFHPEAAPRIHTESGNATR